MIIFGTRGVKSTIERGSFLCPQCNTNKPFRHRKVTKFFTLYFIPIIPLGNRGEYVECNDCKGTFVTRVLETQGQSDGEFKGILETAIMHSMVLIMLADGEVDTNEKAQVLNIVNKFTNQNLNETQLDAYIKKVEQEREDVSTYLKKVASTLNEHGKETIIKCALIVSAADGNIDDSELRVIADMAKAMEMSNTHLKGILAGAADLLNEQQTKKENKEEASRFMPN